MNPLVPVLRSSSVVARAAAPATLAAQTAYELGQRVYDAASVGSLQPLGTVREGFPITNVAAGLGQTVGSIVGYAADEARQLLERRRAASLPSATSPTYNSDDQGWLRREVASPEPVQAQGGYVPPFQRMRQRRKNRK